MDPWLGRTVLDRYRLIRRIGAGGMGSVYEAEQLSVGRSVAVKLLRTEVGSDPVLRDRFRREAEITGRLRHPHTVSLIDYGETPEGTAIIVMELLTGKSLDGLLHERGALSLAEALRIGEQVASSLSDAHQRGLVHRDLKPSNIFVTKVSGEHFCKVLDFGIARFHEEGEAKLTATGQVFGTPRYMAPEQAMSAADVDARADLYSLGLILFECVTGQAPFRATTAIQYLTAHSIETPPMLRSLRPDAPTELERLIDGLLQKDPDKRLPTPSGCSRRSRRSATGSGGTRRKRSSFPARTTRPLRSSGERERAAIPTGRGAYGAEIYGEFDLEAGDRLLVAVGQAGSGD
ncbi:MAG: serine/threonine protein kinase, partial [Myxococcales bacterium]|nr:serine/threonine protein kinase [Myxococcales bacterium]